MYLKSSKSSGGAGKNNTCDNIGWGVSEYRYIYIYIYI